MSASAAASTRQSRWRRSRPFFRENSERNKERFADPEIRLLFLLQAFLQRALDGGGRIERESGPDWKCTEPANRLAEGRRRVEVRGRAQDVAQGLGNDGRRGSGAGGGLSLRGGDGPLGDLRPRRKEALEREGIPPLGIERRDPEHVAASSSGNGEQQGLARNGRPGGDSRPNAACAAAPCRFAREARPKPECPTETNARSRSRIRRIHVRVVVSGAPQSLENHGLSYPRMNFGRWRPSPRRKDAPKDHGEPFYPTAVPGGHPKRERGPPEPAWFDCEQPNAMILSETHG